MTCTTSGQIYVHWGRKSCYDTQYITQDRTTRHLNKDTVIHCIPRKIEMWISKTRIQWHTVYHAISAHKKEKAIAPRHLTSKAVNIQTIRSWLFTKHQSTPHAQSHTRLGHSRLLKCWRKATEKHGINLDFRPVCEYGASGYWGSSRRILSRSSWTLVSRSANLHGPSDNVVFGNER